MNPKRRTYNKHWIPWTKEELISKGIETITHLMPEPWFPNYDKFKEEYEKYNVNEDTTLIGHSCECAFLVRWLGETKQKIKNLILVAPWKIPYREDKSDIDFYTNNIDKLIKERVNNIIMFTADDEEIDGKKSVKIFHDAIGGKIIELKNHGHYCLENMGTEEFPELVNEVIS